MLYRSNKHISLTKNIEYKDRFLSCMLDSELKRLLMNYSSIIKENRLYTHIFDVLMFIYVEAILEHLFENRVNLMEFPFNSWYCVNKTTDISISEIYDIFKSFYVSFTVIATINFHMLATRNRQVLELFVQYLSNRFRNWLYICLLSLPQGNHIH